MGVINSDAKEIILERIKEFNVLEDEIQKRVQMRKEFVSIFTKERIKNG